MVLSSKIELLQVELLTLNNTSHFYIERLPKSEKQTFLISQQECSRKCLCHLVKQPITLHSEGLTEAGEVIAKMLTLCLPQ